MKKTAKRRGEMAIKLWAARLERPLTEAESERLTALLPESRRERLLRVKDPARQREPLCAYLLLRLALRETYGWEALPDIALSPGGKPCFPAHPDVYFNLSHTSGAVLVGLSDHPIGLDIERVRPMSPNALRRLAPGVEESAFFPFWVRREARAKLDGAHMDALLRAETPLRDGEFYYPLDTFPGYAAGAATDRPESPGPVSLYTLDELIREMVAGGDFQK